MYVILYGEEEGELSRKERMEKTCGEDGEVMRHVVK